MADNREERNITVMDFDKVESRNLQGTQFYTPEVKDHFKTDALQYLIYKIFGKEIGFINEKLTETNVNLLSGYDMIIDACDNFEARSAITEACRDIPCIHLGFGKYTWSILWNEGYQPPETMTNFDLCELPGASSFVHMVAAVSSSVVQEYLKTGKQREFTGNKFSIREIE